MSTSCNDEQYFRIYQIYSYNIDDWYSNKCRIGHGIDENDFIQGATSIQFLQIIFLNNMNTA